MAGITWHSCASVLWLHKEGHEKKKSRKTNYIENFKYETIIWYYLNRTIYFLNYLAYLLCYEIHGQIRGLG